MGAAGPFTALPYCSCCWLASPFPLRDTNGIDPLSLVQTLQTPSLRLQPCPSTSYLLQARVSGLPSCLLSLPAWSAQEGCGPWQRYTSTAQLIMSHLLLNAFTSVSSTMTSIIPPKYDCVWPGSVLSTGRAVQVAFSKGTQQHLHPWGLPLPVPRGGCCSTPLPLHPCNTTHKVMTPGEQPGCYVRPQNKGSLHVYMIKKVPKNLM